MTALVVASWLVVLLVVVPVVWSQWKDVASARRGVEIAELVDVPSSRPASTGRPGEVSGDTWQAAA